MKVRRQASVLPAWVVPAANSQPGRAYFSEGATSAQAKMPKINQPILERLPIPIPPVTEQARVLAKVDELMAICDELEGTLSKMKRGGSVCWMLWLLMSGEALALSE